MRDESNWVVKKRGSGVDVGVGAGVDVGSGVFVAGTGVCVGGSVAVGVGEGWGVGVAVWQAEVRRRNPIMMIFFMSFPTRKTYRLEAVR